jgi:potassium channel subfamily K
MISGTLGPVASAFSICSLVRPWRQYYPPGSDIQKASFIRDPAWLTAINAVQLVIAVWANVFLLLNMARRIRFTIAQPVTIVGWYISSISLVSLAATAAGPLQLQPTSEHIWSQAFYYGVYAAAIYFLVASLMTVTFFGAHAGYYDKDFMLTTSQRTLMLQTIMFLMYLLIGALVFSTIEGWNYLDAVYWADVTLFTIGFGDYATSTTLGRALLIPYALIGVISLGLVIGSIRSLMLDRGRRNIDNRIMENKRRKKLRRMTQKGKDEILEPVQGTMGIGGRAPTNLSEFDRRREEFKLMRRIQHQAARRRRWIALAISTSTWLVLWLVGAWIFLECERRYQDWTYFDAFYMCFISLMTIGYGDVTPISNGGKSFFVLWSLLALPTMTILISHAGDTVIKGIRDATDSLGSITILPGDRGFERELKRVLHMASCGVLFEEDIQDTPPGFLGAAQQSQGSESENERDEGERGQKRRTIRLHAKKAASRRAGDKAAAAGRSKANNASSEGEKGAEAGVPTASRSSTLAQLSHRRTSLGARRLEVPEIPDRKAEYRLMLIEEIAQVTQHLKYKPPRRYTFQEWARYLKLIGEDEASAETHRKVEIDQRNRSHGNGKATDDRGANRRPNGGEMRNEDGGRTQWSWVGDKSPLLGSQDEAEWILEKLIRKLDDELREDAE